MNYKTKSAVDQAQVLHTRLNMKGITIGLLAEYILKGGELFKIKFERVYVGREENGEYIKYRELTESIVAQGGITEAEGINDVEEFLMGWAYRVKDEEIKGLVSVDKFKMELPLRRRDMRNLADGTTITKRGEQGVVYMAKWYDSNVRVFTAVKSEFVDGLGVVEKARIENIRLDDINTSYDLESIADALDNKEGGE